MVDLSRFLNAQEPVYATVLAELRSGRKRTHWMWFIFPQITGLGHSAMSRRFAIRDFSEAKAYLTHPILGARLRECVAAVLEHREKTAPQIFGTPDDFKFCSCLTLFQAIAPEEPLFRQALDSFYDGRSDPETIRILGY